MQITENDVHVPNLGNLFQQRAAETPSAIAVINDLGQILTDGALHNKAIELALKLAEKEFNFHDRVGILVRHGIWDAVTHLAILYAGGTCVPLDTVLPDQQIISRLERLGARYVFTDESNHKRDLPFYLLLVGNLDADLDRLSGTECMQIAARSILHMSQHTLIQSSDVVAHINNVSFHAALFDIWPLLLNGASIGVLSKSTLLEIPAMNAAIHRLGITAMLIITPLLNLVAAIMPETFAGLRVVLMGGEAANLCAVEAVFSAGPPEHFIHIYGPTECCVYSLAHEISVEDVQAGKVSIGKPVGRSVCCVCDNEGNVLLDDQEGELLVGGPGVSAGYIDQPGKNKKSFTLVSSMVDPHTNRPYRMYRTGDMVRRRRDGQYDFVGRRDHQVKIRGFRIELDSINDALMKTGHFSEGYTMRIESTEQGAGSSLVAFVVLQRHAKANAVADAKDVLAATFPDYMVPHIEVIQGMPLTSRAKTDLEKLKQNYHHRRNNHIYMSTGDKDQWSTRQHLAGLWATILITPVPEYSDEDDFFALGGTSLQASLLISLVRKQLKTNISLLTLYDHPTLGQLTRVIDRHWGKATETIRDESAIWDADLKLGDNLNLPETKVIDWRLDTEGKVFLSGATGFVGAFLLVALLKMPYVHQVGCLIRAPNPAAALKRLRETLRKYNLWQEDYLSKIFPLCGELEDQWLGLGKERFHDVADWASVIFHLGARVNYTQPYSLHRPANIIGTANIARLAVTGRLKGLHYTSSISCFGPTGFMTGTQTVYQDEPLLPHRDALKYDHGYAQSQWVADELLQRLVKRGFPIVIYRPGFITGDSITGGCNPEDFFSRCIRSSLKLGCYPNLPSQRKEFVPVDYVIAALLHISSCMTSLGQSFHLVPECAESIDLVDTMVLLSQVRGVSLECVPYAKWIERLSTDSVTNLQPVLPMLAENVHNGRSRWELHENMPTYDNSNTMRALETYPGGLSYPLFDQSLMTKYVDHLYNQTMA